MPRLKNRKGAVLVMASAVLVVLVLIMAFVMDLSQMYVQANQVQTAADAGAHAGALQLIIGDSAHVPDTALAFSGRNVVLTHNAVFSRDSVKCGTWDGASATFTSTSTAVTCGNDANAVQVIGTDPSQYIFPALWNLAGVKVSRRAVAYVAPGVVDGTCVKPWSIPYWELTKRLDPTNPDTTRDLTAQDEAQLASLPSSSLMFSLKVSSGSSTSGNFLPVSIGGTGGSVYKSNIESCNAASIGPGDVLQTEPGNMVGPTKQGADSLCRPHYASGACGDGKGGVGLVIKAPLWVSSDVVKGRAVDVTVKMIGSFSLDTVTKNARVVGHFLRSVEAGNITTSKGTLVRILLVQ